VAGGALTIRPAVTHDHDRLVEIWRAAVEATHHFLATQDVDWYERLVRGYLSRMGDVRVAEVTGGAVLGFVAQDDGEIHMLFIDPSHHGRGVGTALLDDIANDFSLLRVDVNEENPSGRRFYAARGFQQVGRSEIDGQGRPTPFVAPRAPRYREEGCGHRRSGGDQSRRGLRLPTQPLVASTSTRRTEQRSFLPTEPRRRPNEVHPTIARGCVRLVGRWQAEREAVSNRHSALACTGSSPHVHLSDPVPVVGPSLAC
jgi:putative acetyltransferase